MRAFWIGFCELSGAIAGIIAICKFPWGNAGEETQNQAVRACFWMLFSIAWYVDSIVERMRAKEKE